MYYYAVHLPLNLNKVFHYSSLMRINEGVRVLVTFNRKDIIGICGVEHTGKPNVNITYRPILEVLDEIPVLPANLLALAKWMSEYYHSSIGSACFAMLPAWLIPDVEAEVKWVGGDSVGEYPELAKLLQAGQPKKLSVLRDALKNKPVLSMVESAVRDEIVEVSRKLSSRDKPKIVNYVTLLEANPDLGAYTPKQREALQHILALNRMEFPLSLISEDVTYSVVRALEKKGCLNIHPRKVEREFFQYDTNAIAKQIEYTNEQDAAIQSILAAKGGFNAHLLYGVTGSGKTEVYIGVIRTYLQEGKNIIFLIPEIALTPQMVERFQAEFGSILAISHSQLSDRQRLQQWHKISRGECRMVIGARSAIFAPMPNLGLVIVDEEHEQSYKQDNNPRYNGRDLAVMRAYLESAQVILGSATPSLESWHNQYIGKYRLHKLEKRPLEIKLPQVRIINLCDDYDQQLLSNELIAAINDRLEKKEQVILFQNRRGYSSFIQCLKCGELLKCSNCEISMYYHRDREEMHCHYCGNIYPSPRKCPKCGSFTFSYGSPGTQKVEQHLQLCFPQARILRLDSDSARKLDSHKSMYRRMKDGEVDILLGTQMISKGLDFPNVTLVGIINADISLNVPDFRAAERTFQLCTQVAGRSGRADKSGEVIIQTYNPGHYSILYAAKHDYLGFAEEELDYRSRLQYPPYFRLGRLLYQCKDSTLFQQEMEKLNMCVLHLLDKFAAEQLSILGPTPAPLAKLNNLHRQHIIIKGGTPALISKFISALESLYSPPPAIQMQIDIDPLSLL